MRILGKIGTVVCLVLVIVSLFNTANIISFMRLHKKDYLSAEADLPKMPSLYYLIFSLIYLCFLVFWIFFKNKRARHGMHILMGVYLFITCSYLMNAAAERYDYVKVQHTPDHEWDSLLFVYLLFRNVLFFWIIALIGSGFCIWKPVLYGMDIFILMVVIIFQVLGMTASIAAGDSTNKYSDRSKTSVLISDYTCCVFMFVPMVYSIVSLRDKVLESEGNNANANAARNLEKLCRFVQVAIGYVLFTRVVVVVGLGPLVVDKWPWVIDAAKETANLVFCMVMLYMYRPLEDNVVVPDAELGL